MTLALALGAASTARADEDEAEEAEGPAVVVTASRRAELATDATVATDVIDRATIDASGARDAGELLRSELGVRVSRSFRGQSVQMRGLDSEHVLVLVDGQRLTGRTDGAVDLSRLRAEDIERIEIVRGPSSALYGSDAMGGVIQIITRDADPAPDRTPHPDGEARLEYGTGNAVRASGSGGLRAGSLHARATVAWRRADAYTVDSELTEVAPGLWWPTPLEPPTQATSGGAFDDLHLGGRVGLDLPTFDLELLVRGRLRDVRAVTANAAGAIFDTRKLTQELGVSLVPTWSPDDRTTLTGAVRFTLFDDQYLSDQQKSDALDTYETTRDLQGEASIQVSHRFPRLLSLDGGLDLLVEHVTSDRLDAPTERVRVSPYGQAELRLERGPTRFALQTGVRVDVDSRFGGRPTPKVALRFEPVRQVVVRGSYGMGFRAPSFSELYLRFENPSAGYRVAGNPDLRPETSHGFDVGVTLRPHAAVTVTLRGYRNELQDLITTLDGEPTASGVLYTYGNVARAWTHGLETELRLAPVAGVDVSVGYELTDSRDRDTDLRLEGRSNHRVVVATDLRHPGWDLTFHVDAEVSGPRWLSDAHGQELRAGYALLDLRLSKRFARSIEIYLGVDNALGMGDRVWLAVPPRRLYGGVAIHTPR